MLRLLEFHRLTVQAQVALPGLGDQHGHAAIRRGQPFAHGHFGRVGRRSRAPEIHIRALDLELNVAVGQITVAARFADDHFGPAGANVPLSGFQIHRSQDLIIS